MISTNLLRNIRHTHTHTIALGPLMLWKNCFLLSLFSRNIDLWIIWLNGKRPPSHGRQWRWFNLLRVQEEEKEAGDDSVGFVLEIELNLHTWQASTIPVSYHSQPISLRMCVCVCVCTLHLADSGWGIREVHLPCSLRPFQKHVKCPIPLEHRLRA